MITCAPAILKKLEQQADYDQDRVSQEVSSPNSAVIKCGGRATGCGTREAKVDKPESRVWRTRSATYQANLDKTAHVLPSSKKIKSLITDDLFVQEQV